MQARSFLPLHLIYRGKFDALNLQGIPPKLVLEFIIFLSIKLKSTKSPHKTEWSGKMERQNGARSEPCLHYQKLITLNLEGIQLKIFPKLNNFYY